MTFTKSRLAVAVVAVTAGFAHAEESQQIQEPKQEAVTRLNQVTVTASRTENLVKDIAGSVTVISEEQIERQLAGNVQELLKYEPGVETQGSGRLGVQGFNIRGLSGNRVKVLVDGVTISNTYEPGGDFLRPEQDYIDIDSLKALEIVKGPGSTLYGSDAMGGVVAFVTKSPADYLKETGDDSYFSGKAAFSSADTGFAETLTFANRSGKLETLLLYTRRDFQETDTHSGIDSQGSARGKEESLDAGLNNILAEAKYTINDDHSVGVKIDWLDQESKSGLEASGDPQDNSDDSRKRQRVSLFHEWAADNNWFDSAQTQLSWQNTKTNQVTYTYASDNRKKDYIYEQGGYQFGTQLNKEVLSNGVEHLLTYGVSWKKEDLENRNKTILLDTGELLPPDTVHQPGRYSPLATSDHYGLFLQDEISLANGLLTLTPGARFDSFELKPETDSLYTTELGSNKGDAITAKIGAVYQAFENASLFAVYSQGFRAPTLDEAYYAYENIFVPNTMNGYAYLANPDLKPEESDSYELGVRFEGLSGSLEITAFYNDYKNFIEQVVIPDSGYTYGAYQNQNIAKATVKGAELRGELWLDAFFGTPDGLTLNAAVAYADGSNKETGDPLESIAPLKGIFGLNYDQPSEQFGGTLSLTLSRGKNAESIDDGSRFNTAGYGVIDLTAYYQPMTELTLRAGLFNMTDKQYWVWEDVRGLSKTGRSPLPQSGLDRYAQPGRNLSVSAKYEF